MESSSEMLESTSDDQYSSSEKSPVRLNDKQKSREIINKSKVNGLRVTCINPGHLLRQTNLHCFTPAADDI